VTSLFDGDLSPRSCEWLEEGALLLPGFAAENPPALLEEG
jgi:hypothetical protein